VYALLRFVCVPHQLTRKTDFILAACDVEGNFLVVLAYQYTNLLSCMLLVRFFLLSRRALTQ